MERVVGREKISLFTRKILTPGVACTLCHQEVNYSGRRKVALEQQKTENGETQEHIQHEQTCCKENRVPYLASSQQSRGTQFWKWVCRKIVSRYLCEKNDCKYSASAIIDTYFCLQNVSESVGTDFNLGFQGMSEQLLLKLTNQNSSREMYSPIQ